MKVRWDDRDAKTAYANVCGAAIAPEEITLRFGMKQGEDAARREVMVALSHSVVLNPMTAKRLALILEQATAQYTFREPSAPPAAPRAPIQRLMQGLPAQARLPLERVASLGCGYVLSGSFKMHRRSLTGQRYLMTINKARIGAGADAKVLELCRALQMPELLLEALAERLEPANYVHFGFEQGDRGSVYKAYVEYWTTWREELEVKRRSEAFVGGYGYKWDPAGEGRSALTRYTCHPLLPLEAMVARVAGVCSGAASTKPVELARGLLEAAARRIPSEKMLYLEADEEGNPRRSFDINLLGAKLLLCELHSLWMAMCEHYEVEPQQFHAFFTPIRNELFSHIQGGVDRDGRDFVTIYYGAEEH